VLYSSFKTGEAEMTIESVIAECRTRKIPLMWRIEPESQPENLGTLLEKHGFQRLETIPGMVINIHKNKGPPYPDGFEIKRVSNEKILSEYLGVIKETVGMPEFAIQGLYDLSVFLGFEEKLPLQRYLGYLNGEPVATCMSVLGVGVVGIYDVITKEKVRKKGIGSIMTFYSLDIAKRLGYNVGVLTSSEMAYNMYKKLGFKEVCKIQQYLWSPQPPT
jgi:predicted GNAT family acetyltransferase